MNKKGFTLVEIIAVTLILGLLITLVTPKIMSNINNKKNVLYENTIKEIERISSTYLTNHPDLYSEISNNGFINISIDSLCIDELIECPINNPKDNSEIE